MYNKSHVAAIMEYSRTNDKSLATTAHELLREISTRKPEILKAHVQEICTILQDEAPNSKRTNDPRVVDNLKACASYASKFADEIPQDLKFIQAMTSFALHGSPSEAAKHAVTIIITASEKKEMLAKDLVNKCVKGFEYGGEGFLARLAALSQLMLLAPYQANQESDAISEITIKEVLLQVRTKSTESPDSYSWSPTLDAECEAKCWALKTLVNRIRSHSEPDTLSEVANPVYKLLSNLITKSGEALSTQDTPSTHKSRLRLTAACLCLKLCTKKHTDALFTPSAFNALALVAQDPVLNVRSSFLQRLKKYLGQQKLPQRFYTIPFLLAFEPTTSLRSDNTTWIRSRTAAFHALKAQQPSSKAAIVMESVFARLLSLLAHHPDYDNTADGLVDFAQYLLYYLQPVATEENLSVIYHIAQRVKQGRDAIDPSPAYDNSLYHLSDLAQLTIRKFEDSHGWNIQTMPGKIRLPVSLFSELKDHEEAQQIAEKNYLPEGVEEEVESLIKMSMRAVRSQGKKRRSEGDHEVNGREVKRSKQIPIRKALPKEKKAKPAANMTKTPKKTKRKSSEEAVPPSERRRSGRVQTTGGAYKEREDEEDDEEMGEGVAVWKYEDGEEVNGDGTSEQEAADEAEETVDEPTPKPSPKPSPKSRKGALTAKGGKKHAKGR